MKPKTLEDMKNIGPAMAGWLRAAGIKTPEQIVALGAVECYRRIRVQDKNAANKMALYALYGAIHNINCLRLDSDIKQILNDMLENADA
jgi:DNA transformation protein